MKSPKVKKLELKKTEELTNHTLRKGHKLHEGWKVLIVDDDESVHTVTQMALRHFSFSGKGIEYLHAYSADEAISLLGDNPDVALVLLDVVMETDDAGFKVVTFLRETIGNNTIRIILRTGQPGQAPAQEVVSRYDINDYKEKTELTATKLYTAVLTALRSYRDIAALEANRQGLERVIEATATMFKTHSISEFAQGVLEQLTALLYLESEAVYCQADAIAACSCKGEIKIIAATGEFTDSVGNDISVLTNSSIKEAVMNARQRQSSVIWSGGVYAAFFKTDNGYENLICVRGPAHKSGYVASLVNLFLRNVSMAFDNIHLQEDLSQEIVERREAEKSASILARLPSELPEPVMRITDSGEVSYANKFSKPILEHIGTDDQRHVSDKWLDKVRKILETGERFDFEVAHEDRKFELILSPIPEAGYVNLFGRDVTRVHELITRLEHTAFHDHLTGIANRPYFRDFLEKSLARPKRADGQVGLMLLDLDRFKQINDAWGHSTGDAVLQEVSNRLLKQTRDTDVVARLGGDEFGIVASDLDTMESMLTCADRVQSVFSDPFVVDGRSFSIGCSIGISTYPTDADNAEDLQQYADLAMYQSKNNGGVEPKCYDHGLQEQAREKVLMEENLRDAIDTNRLEVFYQPLVNLINGRLIGAEALLRLWNDDGTLIEPARFIPLAEETGLIEPIGEFVLNQVCLDIGRWQKAGVATPHVALNLSGKQLWSPSLATTIQEVIDRHSISPSLLEMEITESVLIGHEKNASKTLNQLREIGITLSIDDFGTGYSSLSYLRHLPVSKLKVDRSFIIDMLKSADAMAIIDAILSLGNSLHLRVLAEGIENLSQVEALRAKGCVEGQGYHFGRPVPDAEFKQLLMGGHTLP